MGRQRKYLLLWGLIFGLALTLSLTGYAGFFDDLELSLEKQIGRSGYESIIAEYQVVRLSPEEEERLQNIFDRLVAACGRKNELEFSLTVVEDETVSPPLPYRPATSLSTLRTVGLRGKTTGNWRGF